jgi:hypothetical protein
MRSRTALHQLTRSTSVVLLTAALVANERPTPRFLPTDPVRVDEEMGANAKNAERRTLGRYADFIGNAFFSLGGPPRPATNANTLGEVPNSSWFTTRIGHGMTTAAIVRGPDRHDRLAVNRWIIVEAKDEGRQLGFRAIDAADPTRRLYQIEFDPRGNPEMATGAEVIGTAFYHAFGYNVVETYLIDLDPDQLTIDPRATIKVNGRARSFTRRDLAAIMSDVARQPNGRYRATASPFAEGRYLGPFRYYGVRADDPNDVHPHEYRRELRANRVFAAWLNHDDSRAGNSLDMLVCQAGQCRVKHYMFDFGSLLGSGTNEEDLPWIGHEYMVEPRPGLKTLATLGLWRRPYLRVKAPSDLPAAGNFTADRFDPEQWRPHYPNAAFTQMDAEDAFWGARIVAAFSPAAIAAIVAKAEFSDARTTAHVTATLLQRRERVLQTWLTALNPIANPRITGSVLRFDNAAEDAGLIERTSGYEVSWFVFDNDTGSHRPITSAQQVHKTGSAVPTELLAGAAYAGVELRTRNDKYPDWSLPVRVYFRRVADGWLTVGIDRVPTADAESDRPARQGR